MQENPAPRVPLGYIPEVLKEGDKFAFETWAKRTGIGTVRQVYTEHEQVFRVRPYHVYWEDINGMHHEWFGLEDFKSIIRL